MNNTGLRGKLPQFVCTLLMSLMSLTCIFPVVWIFYSSLKSNTELFGNLLALPKTLHLENFEYVLNEFKLGLYLSNTAMHSIASIVFILLFGFIAGYFLSRYRFRGRNLIYGLFISGVLIPTHALLVPIYMEFRMLHIVNTRMALILPYIIFGLPTAVFLIEAYIKSLPIEMEEAAFIEGASLTQTLCRVIMPMCKPILATVMVLSFNSTWNDFIFNLTLTSGDKYKNISVALRNFGNGYSVDYVKLMAAAAIATLPALVVYTAFNKQIIKGIVEGAVKG